jgi:hypothetical protein
MTIKQPLIAKPSTKKLCKPASPEENGANPGTVPHMSSLLAFFVVSLSENLRPQTSVESDEAHVFQADTQRNENQKSNYTPSEVTVNLSRDSSTVGFQSVFS